MTNLTKVSHDHTFENANSSPTAHLMQYDGSCPAGHGGCVWSRGVWVSVSVSHTTRTTERPTNLTSVSHPHSLSMKTISVSSKTAQSGSYEIRTCPAGHGGCAFENGHANPHTFYLVSLSALGAGETTKFLAGNLTDHHSHTHTVEDSKITFSVGVGLDAGATDSCAAGHSNCVYIGGHPNGIDSYSIIDVTTSSGVI